MVEFPDLAVNLIYSVLCLVPGFLSLQVVRALTDRERELSEFEKTTWSLLGSGLSLSLLYFGYVAVRAFETGELVLVHALDLGWVALVVVYPLLLLVALLVGLVVAPVLAVLGV
ncbi:hypothetical protein [Halovivax limisalsi]|uniref:hypothetical protein n=1 Tax=Halovivax limisalsi TaxID=1453760 RepID=UPI001FFCBBAE|nr:hypothetical protein [Halovivax limisalsi]